MVIKVKEIIKEWLELMDRLFEFKNFCVWCDSELLDGHDHYEWNGFRFCSEDCLKEYLKDGE